jgi:hypothetical protein
VLALPAIWLGLPFVLARGGIMLGALGRHGARRRMAVGAIALGVVVLVLGLVGTDSGLRPLARLVVSLRRTALQRQLELEVVERPAQNHDALADMRMCFGIDRG